MKWEIVSNAMSYTFGGIIGLNLGCVFCKFVIEFVNELLNDDKEEEDKDDKN